MADRRAPMGIFDSGLGGLSVLREIRKALPHEDVFYVADQGHIPYGPRAMEEVRDFSKAIVRFMMEAGTKMILIACNTASAAALNELRAIYPDYLFLGMEPAIKPAAETTQTGVVGVLATPATFQGPLYASVIERFAQDVTVLKDTCEGLVRVIEQDGPDDAKVAEILQRALTPMIAAGVDTIVLGCTHYPFAIPTIRKIVGPDVRIIDPAPSVARHTREVLANLDLLTDSTDEARLIFNTSGLHAESAAQVEKLLGEKMMMRRFNWDGMQIIA